MNSCFVCGNEVKRGKYFCDDHKKPNDMTRVAKSIISQLRRTRKLGLESTLTFPEWMNALAFFTSGSPDAIPHGVIAPACVYCRTHLFCGQHGTPLMDHWYPVSLGGGTTVLNCVPVCDDCNTLKKDLTGDEFFDVLITKWRVAHAPEAQLLAQSYFEHVRNNTVKAAVQVRWVEELRKTGWKWVNEIHPLPTK
jgi:hypothetical protein